MKKSKLTEEDKKAILSYHNQGYTNNEIIKMFHICKTTMIEIIGPTRRKFTLEEDNLILEEVSKSTTNLRSAFEIVGKKLNRSYPNIATRYYNYLKDNKEKNPTFAIGSNHGLAINTKNTPRTKGNDIKTLPINKVQGFDLSKILIAFNDAPRGTLLLYKL
jgi:hypothetical protein